MYDSKRRLSMSKSMGQMPPVHYTAHPPSTSPPPAASHRTRDRVSIANLINAVDNARITSSPSPSPSPSPTPSPHPGARESGRHRRSARGSRAYSAQGSRVPLGPAELDEMAARRRKIQSEKKRLWRKNLSPDQKAKRQELDAQRKREQRMNMTPNQRAEARRKDAARKAAKRRLQKEQLRGAEISPPPENNHQAADLNEGHSRFEGKSSSRLEIGWNSAFSRSTIHDLLN